MPLRFGSTELLTILGIVLLLFGPSRIGKIAGEIGRGIRSLREGLSGEKESEIERK